MAADSHQLFDELEAAASRFDEIETLIQDPAVLADQSRCGPLLREHGALRRKLGPYTDWKRAEAQLAEALAEAAGADDPEYRAMAEEEAETARVQAKRLRTLLVDMVLTEDESGERNAIVEMRAGVGGDEACLWVEDLFRMYTRWAETKKFKIEILDSSANEAGGFKELNLLVKGERVYDLMRWEGGGHRVQRVPATESQGRVHTSAATIAVLPEAEEVDLVINPADLEITAMRSGGPGGQSVNKTSSAIRIFHKPTGEQVHCQVHKSQHKNREMGIKLLRARLYDEKLAKANAERNAARQSMVGTGDRSQRIRTYNYSQNRLTDHRIETGDGDDTLQRNFSLDRVLEGDLDPVHDNLREWHRRTQLKAFGLELEA